MAANEHWDALCQFAQGEMERARVPGLALGVLHEGATYATGLGVTSRDNPLPVDSETLFQIGSITKTFTATAIMRLVELGKADLDAPVRTYLREFRVADAETSEKVTLRHLLAHLEGWDGDLFLDTGAGDDALPKYVRLMADLEQLAPLGQIVSYNNSGFSVAGAIIELVTGQSYEEAMKELVLAPLGLQTCFFDPAEVMTYRFAVGHEDGDVCRPWPLARSTYPAGGIVCHVPDLLAYARFHMGDGAGADGKPVLTPASLAAMRAPQAKVWGDKSFVGISWWIDDALGTRAINHGGSTNGQQAQLFLAPEHGFAAAVLTNHASGGRAARAIIDEAFRLFLGLTRPPKPGPRHASADELAPYAGRYVRMAAEAELGILDGRLIGASHSKIGFPTQKVPVPPPSPPYAADLCEPDRLVIVGGNSDGATIDIIRRPDGAIGWIRSGLRLFKRVE